MVNFLFSPVSRDADADEFGCPDYFPGQTWDVLTNLRSSESPHAASKNCLQKMTELQNLGREKCCKLSCMLLVVM